MGKQNKRECWHVSGKQVLFSVMVLSVHLVVHLFNYHLLYKHCLKAYCALHCTRSQDSVISTPQGSSIREPQSLGVNQRLMQIIYIKATAISIPQGTHVVR